MPHGKTRGPEPRSTREPGPMAGVPGGLSLIPLAPCPPQHRSHHASKIPSFGLWILSNRVSLVKKPGCGKRLPHDREGPCTYCGGFSPSCPGTACQGLPRGSRVAEGRCPPPARLPGLACETRDGLNALGCCVRGCVCCSYCWGGVFFSFQKENNNTKTSLMPLFQGRYSPAAGWHLSIQSQRL